MTEDNQDFKCFLISEKVLSLFYLRNKELRKGKSNLLQCKMRTSGTEGNIILSPSNEYTTWDLETRVVSTFVPFPLSVPFITLIYRHTSLRFPSPTPPDVLPSPPICT